MLDGAPARMQEVEVGRERREGARTGGHVLASFTEETVDSSTGRGVSGGVGTLLSHLQKVGVCSDAWEKQTLSLSTSVKRNLSAFQVGDLEN